MTLFYNPTQSMFEDKKTKKRLWHIRLKKVGRTVGLRDLAKLIAEKSSLTEGDVYNVIANLPKTMRIFLLNSRTVKLDGLGTFTLTISSKGKGVENVDEVNPRQVTSLKCRFTPEYVKQYGGGTTRSMYEGASFEKWSAKSEAYQKLEDTPSEDSSMVPEVSPKDKETGPTSNMNGEERMG